MPAAGLTSLEADEVRRWLEKAGRDESVARKLLAGERPETDVIAFHCQQAIEKLLKAFLVSRRSPFEKIHDLRRLLECCIPHDAAFELLREDVEPITLYAVAFRYPGPADPTRAEAEKALAVAARVREFVSTRIGLEPRT